MSAIVSATRSLTVVDDFTRECICARHRDILNSATSGSCTPPAHVPTIGPPHGHVACPAVLHAFLSVLMLITQQGSCLWRHQCSTTVDADRGALFAVICGVSAQTAFVRPPARRNCTRFRTGGRQRDPRCCTGRWMHNGAGRPARLRKEFAGAVTSRTADPRRLP